MMKQVEHVGDFWDEEFGPSAPNSPRNYLISLYFLLVTMSTIGKSLDRFCAKPDPTLIEVMHHVERAMFLIASA